MSYPLASSSWDDAEYAAIQAVVDSGFFSMGKHVENFERDFAAYTGSRHCVMVNSGSSANLMMIAALRFRQQGKRLEPGDQVIVPAVSWSTTYFPLTQYGLEMRMVDVHPLTLNMDLDAVEAAITPRTEAIFAVNLLGNPNDFSRLQAIADGNNLLLVEDNCESLGATYLGKQAGSFGLMGSFSSFFSHHIATMEGGMIVTDDEELYHIMLSLRSHGWTRHLPMHNCVTGEKSSDPFVESFRFVLPGYNLRPVELSGAIGIEQVKKLPEIVRVRRENAGRFAEAMGEFSFLRRQQEIGESSWFGFSLIVEDDAPFTRRELVAAMTEAKIDARPIVAGNFAKNEALKYCPHSISGSLRNAECIDETGLFVGNHHYEMRAEFELLRKTIEKLAS